MRIWCGSFCTAFLILWAGYPLIGQAQEPSKTIGSFQALRECYEKPETLMPCGAVEIRKLLQNRTGGELATLMHENLPEYMCHQFGHIVGRQVFERSNSLESAMDECGYGCGGACFHGAVEAAFLDELEIDPETADPHIAHELVLENAKKFCRTATTCHGVGHLLFQLYNDFDEPLTLCKDIARGFAREDCYRGVFMDHAMKFSAYNVLLGDTKKQTYDPDNLLFPCTQVKEEYSNACYRYQPRLQNIIFDENGIVSRTDRRNFQQATCESLGTTTRQDCFEGLGVAFSDIGITNPEYVRMWSDGLSLTTDKIAFTRGMIRYMAAHGYKAKAFNYCWSQSERRERWSCYYDTAITLVFIALQYRT